MAGWLMALVLAPAVTDGAGASTLERLLACRALPGATDRLACFDRELAALGGSVERRDVIVIDRGEAKATERARFGLRTPRPDPFAGPGGKALASINGAVASAGQDVTGKWQVTLADQSRWRQIDDYPLSRAPKAGQPVLITRAALGSYKMTVAGQSAIRVTRER